MHPSKSHDPPLPSWGLAPSSVEHTIAAAAAYSPAHLAQVLGGLGWSVTSANELLEYLQRTTTLAVRTLRGAHHAGVTATTGGAPFTAVHTGTLTLDVDAHQYEAGDGPCLHAMRTGEVVRVDVATSAEQWPQFTDDATAAGIRSFLAAPLGTHDGQRLGALNLYSHDPDGFDPEDEVVLQVLLDQATRTLTDYARLTAATDLAAQLQQSLSSRAPIEQAKGILMAAHQINADTAFAMLRAQSQNTNTKLHQVATDLVARVSPQDGTD